MKVVAVSRFLHGGEPVVQGQVLTVSEADGKDLIALRMALPHEAAPSSEPQGGGVLTASRVALAEDQPPVVATDSQSAPDDVRVKRRYRRRDSRAAK